MGESIALRQLDNLESLFAQADLTNVSKTADF